MTLGIEEEFVLLDPGTLSTVDAGAGAVAALGERHHGHVTHEFFESQVEYSSPVFRTLDEAQSALVRFRVDLATWALDHGVMVASAGTPYRTTAGGQLHSAQRYRSIGRDIAGMAADHQINGMHVHVGIASREEGVHAVNALRPWLPILLALSANSPFWQGRDTGWSSWRSLHSRRWTTYGIPPRFETVEAYDHALGALDGLGATSDAGTVNWNVRLSAAHPTIETRVCDGQLDAASTVALAALIRALVHGAGSSPIADEPAPGVWDAALWHAGRHGLSGELVDPRTGALAPATLAVASLREHTSTALCALGDDRTVDAFLARVLRDGTGCEAQRHSIRRGEHALADLYRERLVAAT